MLSLLGRATDQVGRDASYSKLLDGAGGVSLQALWLPLPIAISIAPLRTLLLLAGPGATETSIELASALLLLLV